MPGVLTLATANLLSGRSLRDGEIREPDLRAAARVLDADVVGLQEVDLRQPRSAGVDQARLVAEELGARHWRFVPALHGTPDGGRSWTESTAEHGDAVDGPAYGVALVSRRPVARWEVLRLRGAPVSLPMPLPGARTWIRVADEPRVALAAVVEGERGPFTVVTTHLSFVPGWNVGQLRRVARWAAAFPGPRLLVGDLNLPGRIPARLTGWEPLAGEPTFPAPRPRVQLDHVLSSGLEPGRCREVRAVALPVSDHRALAVTLDL